MNELWQILIRLMQRSGHQLRIHEGRTTPARRPRKRALEYVVWHDMRHADSEWLYEDYTKQGSKSGVHLICDGPDLYVVCPVEQYTYHMGDHVIDEAKTGCTNTNSIGVDVVTPGAASALVGAALVMWLDKEPTDALGMMLHDEVLPWWDIWDAIRGVWRQR